MKDKWIKVSDRLPKDGEYVLAYDDLEGLVTADYEEAYEYAENLRIKEI